MLAKGKVYVSKEELNQLFNIPENAEVIAVRSTNEGDGFEFLIMSADEIENVTVKSNHQLLIRRVSLSSLRDRKEQS